MSDIKSKLADRLLATDDKERCGFVTKRGRIVEVQNVADDPTKSFKISPSDVIHWIEKGVVATWHTHPHSSANLSGEDYQCFTTWSDLSHYIISHDKVVTYHVEGGLVVQE